MRCPKLAADTASGKFLRDGAGCPGQDPPVRNLGAAAISGGLLQMYAVIVLREFSIRIQLKLYWLLDGETIYLFCS